MTTAEAWLLDLRAVSGRALRRTCLAWLDADERARLETLRPERSRHDFMAARALCRATLSRYAGVDPSEWRFSRTAHGKPTVAAPFAFESLRFNLSHTDGLAICLVSRAGEVGVDVEAISQAVDVDRMARHFATEREQARLQTLTPARRAERFFEQWVLREAYLKGMGTGIAAGAERFSMSYDDVDRVPPIGEWHFSVRRPTSKHVAAAAIRLGGATGRLAIRWRTADDVRRLP